MDVSAGQTYYARNKEYCKWLSRQYVDKHKEERKKYSAISYSTNPSQQIGIDDGGVSYVCQAFTEAFELQLGQNTINFIILELQFLAFSKAKVYKKKKSFMNFLIFTLNGKLLW